LYLSCKYYGTLKSVNDFVNVYQELKLNEKLNSDNFSILVEKFLNLEYILLKTLNFEFKITLPYSFIDSWVKNMSFMEKEMQKELLKKSMTFADDCLRTRAMFFFIFFYFSLIFKPKQIAASCVYLGSIYLEVQVSIQKINEIHQFCETNVDEIKRICIHILELYDESEKFLKMKRKAFEVQILFTY
jgi:hypothetical protein